MQDGVRTWACVACSESLAPGAGLGAIAATMLHTRPIPRICPNCGTTQTQAIETGLVGCPLCYEMLEPDALNHFGIAKGMWSEEKNWSLHLPLT